MPRSQHDPVAAAPIVSAPHAAAVLALALWLSAAGCADSVPEGTTRPLRATYASGVVRTEGTEVYRGGKWLKHGPITFFDEDGDEVSRGQYTDGVETGEWHERYDDGGTGHGHFVDGLREGEWLYMHKNGRLHQKGRYERGERVGVWKEWSPAGEARADREYKTGGAR